MADSDLPCYGVGYDDDGNMFAVVDPPPWRGDWPRYNPAELRTLLRDTWDAGAAAGPGAALARDAMIYNEVPPRDWERATNLGLDALDDPEAAFALRFWIAYWQGRELVRRAYGKE